MKRLLYFLPLLLLLPSCHSWKSTEVDPAVQCDSLLADSKRYAQVQEFDLATDYALRSRSLAQAASLPGKEAESLCQLAVIDLLTWRDEQAWDNACQAEKIAREGHYNVPLISALLQKGKVCAYSGITQAEARDDEALAYFEEARNLAEVYGTVEQRVDILYNLSQVYVNKNRFNNPLDKALYAKAGEFLDMGVDLAERSGLSFLLTKSLTYKMRYFRQGGKTREAIDCCYEVIERAPEKDYLTKEQAYNQLVMLYASIGEVEQAAAAHQQYIYANEYYMQQKADSKLQEMETRFESDLKQEQLESRKVLVIFLVITLLMLLAVLTVIIVYTLRIRRSNERLAAANKGKEDLLGFISRNFTNPDFNRQVTESMEDFQNMDEDQILKRCAELVKGSNDLNGEVAGYISNLMVERKRAVSKVGLTPREMEVIRLSGKGMSSAEIAKALHISVYTVNNHKQNIYSKLEVKSNAEMLHVAGRIGII